MKKKLYTFESLENKDLDGFVKKIFYADFFTEGAFVKLYKRIVTLEKGQKLDVDDLKGLREMTALLYDEKTVLSKDEYNLFVKIIDKLLYSFFDKDNK